MTKQIANAAVEGRRKTERQRTRWRGELENNFNIMEINKRQEVVRDRSGKQKDFIGSQDPRRILTIENNNNNKKKKLCS